MNQPNHPAARRAAAHPAMRILQATLATAFAASALVAMPSRAGLVIGNNPLYLTTGKANVLVILDNSNSMDEAATGEAVGSASPSSKSEIARGVVRGLTDTYRNRVNMGLMGYRQSATSDYNLHNSPYDVLYGTNTPPASLYNPDWTGARSSTTKKYKLENPTSPGNYIYYNVALPFYSAGNAGTRFCYSDQADASNDFVNGGPVSDRYRCFSVKTGPSNDLPTYDNDASELAAGYSGTDSSYTFGPTDSDFAQGISDFGRFMTWNWVSKTWYANDAPGRGRLEVPLGILDATQAGKIKDKLACSIPGYPAPCAAGGMKNAGLTPIEGTLLTALDYFKDTGPWRNADEGYTGDCYPLPVSCKKDFVVLLTDGLPSTNKSGTALSNPAVAIAEAAAAAGSLKANEIETYVIGFALPQFVDQTSLDQIAVAGGTTKAYFADNTANLQVALNTIFDDILRKTSAFGAVAQNSTAINTGSMIFQGRFDSTDWHGEIRAMRPQSNGTLSFGWSSADDGRIPEPASRKVFTRDPVANTGKEFKLLADLTAAQAAALNTVECSATLTGDTCTQARIDWLRGDRTYEPKMVGTVYVPGPLRQRSKIFGDVISSAPFYVKATNTVYVGANDGMLHAIDAANGNELFTYIPNAVFPSLQALTQQSYSHAYTVDGEIAVSTDFETPGKSILVGALGRGGRTLFGLNVTTPASFGTGDVLWEYTDADLGLVLGKPIIAKMNNGVGAVIVGNGVNSDGDKSVLFIINAQTGALIRKIDTLANGSNGMSTPRGWDDDGNGTVDYIYAGDLQGNLWKFDLRSAAPADWVTSIGTAAAPLPLFVAKDNDGNRQPITGMPGLGINARKGDPNFGKRYVFFGTGRYITSEDKTDLHKQSWYGLIDSNAAIADRTALKQRSIDLEETIAGTAARAFSVATAGDMAGMQGWYIDLVSPLLGAKGERMIGEHKMFDQVLIAVSIVPKNEICDPEGTGYINVVDPFTGASLTTSFFNLDNNEFFDQPGDRLSGNRVIGSVDPGIKMPSDGIIIGQRTINNGTSGDTSSKMVKRVIRTGRISWREVVTK